MDKKIDETILALLLGKEGSGLEKIDVKSRFRKGDRRTVIHCDEIEDIFFERKAEKANDAETHEDDGSDGHLPTIEFVDDNSDGEPSDLQGKPPNPTGPGSTEVRQAGQKRADKREMVRRAARRAVVFGFPIDQAEGTTTGGKASRSAAKQSSSEEKPRRKCEAVMNGQVVEPSFAKGNWAIRWRE